MSCCCIVYEDGSVLEIRAEKRSYLENTQQQKEAAK